MRRVLCRKQDGNQMVPLSLGITSCSGMTKRESKMEWESLYGNHWHKMYWRRFWNTLSDAARKTPSLEIPLICGDINGHIGDKANMFHGVHGGFGYGCQNEDSVRILEFAENHELSLLNFYFKKRGEHLITYKNGMSCTQIDFIVVRQHRRLFRNTKFIEKCRSDLSRTWSI
ncbi:hypothetical protein HELRODRAFT_182276 [Helobdella robusta]|uniref:Endonuclease/exonuclease/phosphatase domain-containing protein n=1 Tax=Helobdella robusta TaxID=6412 RepID=T1FI08_HELRO|nr:hypothetical protein HELRODRAFT_182276 [Helobdella robusta]ESN91048.1 hypothetical protein HELRODRAFT_182276 [Helobdella robusta]